MTSDQMEKLVKSIHDYLGEILGPLLGRLKKLEDDRNTIAQMEREIAVLQGQLDVLLRGRHE